MSQKNQIQLDTSCILYVPFQTYDNDFLFIVNGEEFKTNRFISDLLSPLICKIHLTDPTFSSFTINTQNKGNFSLFLDLFNFQKQTFSERELSFIIEIIETLENDSIKLQDFINYPEITIENVFIEIEKHEKFRKFFSKRLLTEIDFVSSHFFEICETKKSELIKLDIGIIVDILNNHNLRLNTEDQLLNFINELFVENVKYSILYETIFFKNVSAECMKQFADVYDYNYLTSLTWIKLTNRFLNEIKMNKKTENERYNIHFIANAVVKEGKNFIANESNHFLESSIT